MNADTIVLFLCAALLAACAGYFIVHKDYEDGVVGNAALWSVCAVGTLIVYSIAARGERYELDNLTVVLLVAITVFVARHATRFWRWHTFGVHSWKEAKDRFCERRECVRRQKPG